LSKGSLMYKMAGVGMLLYQFFRWNFSTKEIEKQERQKQNYKTVGWG
jgi:hypothetical protein